MRIFLLCITLLALINSCNSSLEDDDVRVINKWLSAWKYMSNKIPMIDNHKDVDYVFFNDTYVYSTSKKTVKNGDEIIAIGSTKKWFRGEHHNKIVLPNGEIINPIITVFTVPKTSNNKSPFFVMPLNSFWKKYGLKSKNSTLENLTTAIFLHEFSHTQQLETFGKKISEFELNNKSKIYVSDNLIQDLFMNDTDYCDFFQLELKHLYYAIENKDDNLKFEANLKIGIKFLKKRQDFIKRKNRDNKLIEIDNQFLTIEGLGQYLMYDWLKDENGGNLCEKDAIEEVRRNKKKWSQDEGLILFLIQDFFSKNKEWIKNINKGITITEQFKNFKIEF